MNRERLRSEAMEGGATRNRNIGEHCHALPDVYVTFRPRIPFQRTGRAPGVRPLGRPVPEEEQRVAGRSRGTFNYMRVEAVRVAMKVAQRRGDVGQHEFPY